MASESNPHGKLLRCIKKMMITNRNTERYVNGKIIFCVQKPFFDVLKKEKIKNEKLTKEFDNQAFKGGIAFRYHFQSK